MGGPLYQHLDISGHEQSQGFTNPRRGGGGANIPVRDQASHSQYLLSRLDAAWSEEDDARAVVQTTRRGAYIEFEGEPEFDLVVESLERRRSGIRLCNVREMSGGDGARTLATVYVPHEKRQHFLKVLWDYAVPPEEGKKPKHDKLVRSISDIRRAVLESFWRPEERDQILGASPDWVEVWLGTESGDEISQFRSLLESLEVTQTEGQLTFPERSVLLINATGGQLASLIERSDLIVEFRVVREVATYYVELENRDQVQLVQDLLQRTRFEGDGNVVVCILDSGVNRGHVLLQPVLDASDMHAVIRQWGAHDNDGHGTLMAGTAAYGDLLGLLNGNSAIRVSHRLESSKILPPPPAQNPKELWGHRTVQGVSLAEIQAPERRRIVCLAVTSIEDRDRGHPSSWSAAIDAMASGYEEETKRLIVVSAGNVEDSNCWRNYPDDNKTNAVHDPGQAWNALTVGAYTDKVRITDPQMASWNAIAPAGDFRPTAQRRPRGINGGGRSNRRWSWKEVMSRVVRMTPFLIRKI